MPGRALSERVKRQNRRQHENACMQAAIDEYEREQLKPHGVKKQGLRPIANANGVNWSTLHHLVNGGTSMSKFNALKRKLTHAEERILVDFILESADRALPMSLKNIEVHANSILTSRTGDADTVGGSWVGRFLDQY